MKAISKDSFPALLKHSASQPERHVTPPVHRAGSSFPCFNIAFLQLDVFSCFSFGNNHHFLFATTAVRTRPTELILRNLYIFQPQVETWKCFSAHCEWENRNRYQYFLDDYRLWGNKSLVSLFDSSLILGANLTEFLCSQYSISNANLKIPNSEYSKIWKF